MNLYYCETCGVRIADGDLPRGLDPGDERLKLCPKHRAKGSNLNVPVLSPEAKVGSNPLMPPTRTTSATRMKSQKAPQRPGEAAVPPGMTIKVVAGLGAVGLLVFVASLFSGKEKPTPSVSSAPDTTRESAAAHSQSQTPTIAMRSTSTSAAVSVERNTATKMASLDTISPRAPAPLPKPVSAPEPVPAPAGAAADTKSAAPAPPPASPNTPMGFMSGDTGDIREELAQSHLQELIAQEKENKLSPRQLRSAYSKFIASNASTKAGRDADARLKALPPPPPVTVDNLKEGLVASWNWDEVGNDVTDRSGRNVGGTLAGATRQADKSLSVLSFDGNGNSVNVPTEPFRTVTRSFTITCWAKPSAERGQTPESAMGTAGIQSQRYAIFPTQGGTYWGPENAGVGLSIGTNGISVMEHGDGYLPSVLVHNVAISDWVLVVLTYDNNKPTLYINGNFAKDGVTGSKTTHPGQSLGGTAYGWYRGLLGEVRIYNRALAPEEVKALFDAGQK